MVKCCNVRRRIDSRYVRYPMVLYDCIRYFARVPQSLSRSSLLFKSLARLIPGDMECGLATWSACPVLLIRSLAIKSVTKLCDTGDISTGTRACIYDTVGAALVGTVLRWSLRLGGRKEAQWWSLGARVLMSGPVKKTGCSSSRLKGEDKYELLSCSRYLNRRMLRSPYFGEG